MTSDNYEIQNILQYTRKSCKKNRNGTSLEAFSSGRREDVNEELPNSPRSDKVTTDTASCSCDIDTEAEIANILHKKCPVIALAQQQLQRLLEETDNLLCDNTRNYRSTYDFLILCKDILWTLNKYRYGLIFIILIFIIGLMVGAASCGFNLRKFNSPILTCLDNFFISDTHTMYEESFRAIV